jgi:hypothetical protein
MPLGVAEMALVSPLGLSPSEHVFFWRAEVAPHTSGAFADREGESLPLHDCPWIPATRPWASRIRLLAKQALARVWPTARSVPVIVVAPREAVEGEADLVRFLTLSGHTIAGVRSGAAAYVSALVEAQRLLASEPEVVVLAVDSLLSPAEIAAWLEVRYSTFTRNPLPPSEGAAAVRLVPETQRLLAGRVISWAAAQSEATDRNDLPADGRALERVLADLRLPARVPLVVGPHDVDPLRTRDFHLAVARHHARLDRAEMPSLEGRVGRLGDSAGLMSAVFALAWLRHVLPLPEPVEAPVALAWARAHDGMTGGVLVGGPGR